MSNVIFRYPCLFLFVRPLHKVTVLLLFTSFRENDRVHFSWLGCYLSFFFWCAQSSPVLRIFYTGNDVGGFLVGVIFATWLAIILWPFSCLSRVLYLCTSGTLYVIPYYGCGISGLTYVSYSMTRGSVWGSCILCALGS